MENLNVKSFGPVEIADLHFGDLTGSGQINLLSVKTPTYSYGCICRYKTDCQNSISPQNFYNLLVLIFLIILIYPAKLIPDVL